ncbi:hypothetical protein [Burkholderia singularis]|nr:hypothetical protein [Burkholderia singularis]
MTCGTRKQPASAAHMALVAASATQGGSACARAVRDAVSGGYIGRALSAK